MVLAHVYAHPSRVRHSYVRGVLDNAAQPAAPDPRLSAFPIGDRRIGVTLRLGIDSHVEQSYGSAPSLLIFADLLVGNGGRDVTQQVPGLFGTEVEVSLLTVGVHGGGLTIEPVNIPLFGAFCEEGLHPLEELVPTIARVYNGLSGFCDRRVDTFKRQSQRPHR